MENLMVWIRTTMSLKPSKIYFGLLIVVLTIASTACGASQASMPLGTKIPMEKPTSNTMSTAESASLAPSVTPTIQVTLSATAPVVTVTAVTGDLSIRTGPDISFDAIDKLKKGETVPVLARSIMDGWIQIGVPAQTGKTGWVSIKTNHSIVNGNLLDLPRIDLVEWNVGSYLRNCTPHQLIVKPGDKILQPVSDTAGNRAWFPPGSYSVYDLDMSGQPMVASLRVLAHSDFNILKDGDRYQWDCPLN